MSFDNESAALEALRASHLAGRLGHAYAVEGPLGRGRALVMRFVSGLLREDDAEGRSEEALTHLLETKTHPDAFFMEPQGKARKIVVEQVRNFTRGLSRTSVSGGWKVGVLLHADRLNPAAANALLKMLEEPPPRSLLFLVTEAPQALLATIRSRCQRITLAGELLDRSDPWTARALELFRQLRPGHEVEALGQASELKVLLDEVMKEAERLVDEEAGESTPLERDVREARATARAKKVRSDILKVLTLWRRDVLLCALGSSDQLHFSDLADDLKQQAEGVSVVEASAEVESVGGMLRKLEHNLPNLAVFEADALRRVRRNAY